MGDKGRARLGIQTGLTVDLGAGDDGEILINLKNIPSTIQKIIIAINTHQAKEQSRNFGPVRCPMPGF